MGLPQRDAAYHTYRDYLTWPEDVRYELINGVAYMMAPAPARVHQEVAGEIFRQVANALHDKPCHPFIAPFDVRLPKSNESDASVDTVVQPDLLVVCDASKLDDRGMRGAPDWVVEVLSPSSASHDQTIKLTACERAGVPEAWLVHPIDHVVTVYRLAGSRYGRPGIFETKGALTVAAAPGITIDWDQVFPVAAG